jgi:hypothetical protein
MQTWWSIHASSRPRYRFFANISLSSGSTMCTETHTHSISVKGQARELRLSAVLLSLERKPVIRCETCGCVKFAPCGPSTRSVHRMHVHIVSFKCEQFRFLFPFHYVLCAELVLNEIVSHVMRLFPAFSCCQVWVGPLQISNLRQSQLVLNEIIRNCVIHLVFPSSFFIVKLYCFVDSIVSCVVLPISIGVATLLIWFPFYIVLWLTLKACSIHLHLDLGWGHTCLTQRIQFNMLGKLCSFVDIPLVVRMPNPIKNSKQIVDSPSRPPPTKRKGRHCVM